jgi:hypothetical protein
MAGALTGDLSLSVDPFFTLFTGAVLPIVVYSL